MKFALPLTALLTIQSVPFGAVARVDGTEAGAASVTPDNGTEAGAASVAQDNGTVAGAASNVVGNTKGQCQSIVEDRCPCFDSCARTLRCAERVTKKRCDVGRGTRQKVLDRAAKQCGFLPDCEEPESAHSDEDGSGATFDDCDSYDGQAKHDCLHRKGVYHVHIP